MGIMDMSISVEPGLFVGCVEAIDESCYHEPGDHGGDGAQDRLPRCKTGPDVLWNGVRNPRVVEGCHHVATQQARGDKKRQGLESQMCGEQERDEGQCVAQKDFSEADAYDKAFSMP